MKTAATAQLSTLLMAAMALCMFQTALSRPTPVPVIFKILSRSAGRYVRLNEDGTVQASGDYQDSRAHWRVQSQGTIHRLENVHSPNYYLVFARSAEHGTTLVGHDDLNRDLLHEDVFPVLQTAGGDVSSVEIAETATAEALTTSSPQEEPTTSATTSSGEMPTSEEESTVSSPVHTDFNWLLVSTQYSFSLRTESGDCYMAFEPRNGLPLSDMCQLSPYDERTNLVITLVQ